MTNPNSETITSDAVISKIELTSDAVITGTARSLNSDAVIRAKRQTILCDGEVMDEIVDEFGADVVIRVVTKTAASDDNYSTPVESYVDYSKVALIQNYTSSDDEVKEGIFKSGEIVFGFGIQDESLIVPGNRILYAGSWYEIQEIQKQPMMDVNYFLQARVRKI